MTGVTESDVARFFHQNRAAKRKPLPTSTATPYRPTIQREWWARSDRQLAAQREADLRERARMAREARRMDHLADRHAYERSLE